MTKETLNEALSLAENKSQNCKRTLVSSTGAKQVIHVEVHLGNNHDQRRPSV
jgi:hypothetical protein